MKKIIQEKVREESQYFCDKHPERECFSELKTASWYGSDFDMTGIEIHLCDECLKGFYEHCWATYAIKPHDIDV
jgi:hypothetical protein